MIATKERKRLGELLVEARLVTQEQVAAALSRQAAYGGQLGRLLVNAGALTEDGLARFLASHLRLPLIDLQKPIDDAVVRLVPIEMAQRYALFPAAIQKDGSVAFLVVAMADPTNLEAIDAVKFKTGRRVLPGVTTETAVDTAIRRYHYGERRKEVQAQSPAQFAGAEIDLEGTAPAPVVAVPLPVVHAVVEPEIPVVHGVVLAPLPSTASTEIMDLTDLEAEPEPELTFSAMAPPLSSLAPSGFAPPLPPIARETPNVRSTGSPEKAMAKTPEALAAAPYCPDCGASRVATAKFCPHCGCSFTGASRAKGAPPAVAPPTRPMMPAAAALPTIALVPGAPLDVEALEGLRFPPGANVVQLRPRTATAANVDEPGQLGGKESHLGLGVTALVPSIVSEASRPDDPEIIAGKKPTPSPVAPMHLHRVTESMARVDDEAALAPPSAPGAAKPKAPASWSAPPTLVVATPAPAAASSSPASISSATVPPWVRALNAIGPGKPWTLEDLEGISRTSLLTASAALVDDEDGFGKGPGFKLALGVTHMAAVHADAALVDEPDVLRGEKPAPTRILRAIFERTSGAFGKVDDTDVLSPKLSLARDWADAAEKPIPRKDDRQNAPVPKSREIFLTPTEAPPAPPPPEPKVEYIPAPPVAAAVPAPWASFAPPPAAVAPAGGPGLATMIMSLNDFEKQALAERLRQKAADSDDKDKK